MFSYNLAAFADINGKLLCELLPSDKFNNSDKFTSSPFYHHFSIPVSTVFNLVIKLFFKYRSTFVHDSEGLIVVKTM